MKNWGLWLIAGIVSLIAGLLALANPLASTLTVELLAGYSLFVVGVLTLFSAFGAQGWSGRIVSILLGIAILVMGITLVGHPLKGILSLTIMVGLMMVFAGVFRLLIALAVDNSQLRFALIISGILSIVLATMIFANWPQSAAIVLGLFLAIELISNGVSMIVLALSRKKAATIS